ncbi:hypothetical protein G6F65_018738 [Rhizopus arrhizus]|nr:hypothetical protein G6F65_018738 [Rhizopus arrhizus]
MVVEDPAVVAQADAARASVHQPGAQVLLKPRDAFADGRPRQAQLFGGCREALRIGHAHERQQIADVIQTTGRGGFIVHELSLVYRYAPTLSAEWKQ